MARQRITNMKQISPYILDQPLGIIKSIDI